MLTFTTPKGTRSGIKPQVKWVVSLVIEDGHFLRVWVCIGSTCSLYHPEGQIQNRVGLKRVLILLPGTRHSLPDGYPGTRYSESHL